MSKKIRTYSELISLSSFEERFNYLKLHGQVGIDTFGFDRIFNQQFYRSTEWKRIRDEIIVRDCGCDLCVEGHEIFGQKIFIHHMNPILLNDIKESTDFLMNPEFLITTIHSTHNAIHYGNDGLIPKVVAERTRNDTCPWKKD